MSAENKNWAYVPRNEIKRETAAELKVPFLQPVLQLVNDPHLINTSG